MQLKISLSVLLVINRVPYYRKSIAVIRVKIQDLISRDINSVELKMNNLQFFIKNFEN